MPNPRFSGGRWSMLSPSIQTSPALAGINPEMMFRAVDLPQPLGPRKVTNCLPRTSRAKPRSTVFVPNRLVIRNRRDSIVSFMIFHRYAVKGGGIMHGPPLLGLFVSPEPL